ncbi:uncharacterized protein KY384_003342 [Bacidia gigantensis]|uniref:uncharacterized protein n=1 Tax=Bacidia gigantensis TaxID=2732470 RepID=UPI001D041A9B|nr:uncharacterized protein KY384_003342 [Bacidia gigantensis]KAG8531710.1 hypothetical protein KY384_003342 [Bacidia gigantensis]
MTDHTENVPQPIASYGSTSSRNPLTSFTNSDNTHTTSNHQAHRNRLSIAALARDKTQAALASIRPKTSQQSLHSSSSSQGSVSKPASNFALPGDSSARHQKGYFGFSTTRPEVRIDKSGATSPGRAVSPGADGVPQTVGYPNRAQDKRQARDRSLSPTNRDLPSPPAESPQQIAQNKMHQTSSRLLRMTEEERPFTRDFEDLFSTLMVSLPLTSHRVRFAKVDHTFTSEEAINNLGSLKFSQSNRMPDPKDPSRIVTTTTTTTFSMAKEMARSVCQRFMDARFVEHADSKIVPIFPLKNAVWQLTPKGMHVLTRFCQRNGINQRHVLDLLDSPRNAMQLVILERDGTTDKLSHDRATIDVIFRRFAGQDGPNVKNSTSASDNDSLSDYYNGLVGVKLAKERKILDRVVPNTFTGKAGVDWLMDCCTTVDRREVFEIAELFVTSGLIWAVVEDKVYAHQNPGASKFQPTKNAIYGFTDKGQRTAGWLPREESPSSEESRKEMANARRDKTVTTRDSNNNRLHIIVNDPALRLLFREYLRDTHCEENLAFYIEVREFTRSYDSAERAKAFTRLDAIREQLAAAYGLYNAFLAPGSPCELNIDHNLRNSLAGRMTRAVGDDDSLLKSLQEVVALFREAQTSVFKLMSSDSVPKFLKEPKYAPVLAQHNFDHAVERANHMTAQANQTVLPERSRSKAIRDRDHRT